MKNKNSLVHILLHIFSVWILYACVALFSYNFLYLYINGQFLHGQNYLQVCFYVFFISVIACWYSSGLSKLDVFLSVLRAVYVSFLLMTIVFIWHFVDFMDLRGKDYVLIFLCLILGSIQFYISIKEDKKEKERMKKAPTLTLDGHKFSNFEEFVGYMNDIAFTVFPWNGSLDAFADLLNGGFENPIEKIEIVDWINFDFSMRVLGQEATINFLESSQFHCHPSNRKNIEKKIERVKRGKEEYLYGTIIRMMIEEAHLIVNES